MEPVTIAIICVVAFGVVLALSAFIRQLLLSRDKLLNDKAQKIALQLEIQQLEKMRAEMYSSERADINYEMLGENKEAIKYLDEKINDILQKKAELIQRYADIVTKVSLAIIEGNQSSERKELCDNLKAGIDKQLLQYDKELEQLQERRTTECNQRGGLQTHLLDHEKQRNKHLASMYKRHTNLLEKIYLRHIEQSEVVAVKNTEGSSDTYKHALTGTAEMMKSCFSAPSNLQHSQSVEEIKKRRKIYTIQEELNESSDGEIPVILMPSSMTKSKSDLYRINLDRDLH